jgi:hypothetical protein
MRYFLSKKSVLKWLESPSVYETKTDELYELDDDSFEFMKKCASEDGCRSEDTEFIDYCLEEAFDYAEDTESASLIKSYAFLRYLNSR